MSYQHNAELDAILKPQGCEQITESKGGRGGYWFEFVFSDDYEFCVTPVNDRWGFYVTVNDRDGEVGHEFVSLSTGSQANGNDIVGAAHRIIRAQRAQKTA